MSGGTVDFDRRSLRHAVATLAYRAAKTIRGAPESFATFKPGPSTKTPLEIVATDGTRYAFGFDVAAVVGAKVEVIEAAF